MSRIRHVILLIPFLFYLQVLEAQVIDRGPYLQSATQNSILIKWKSNKVVPFSLVYGLKKNNLDQLISGEGNALENEIYLDNLKGNTKYFYRLILSETESHSGYFQTLPPIGDKEEIRIVAFGDCGTGTAAQKKVLSSVLNYYGETTIDGLLLLGDIAYNYGREEDFQARFFPIYQESLLKNTVLWPSIGNHDYADRTWPNDWGMQPFYFDAFSLPTQGQSGGLASQSEAYYSFDIANVHFVSLDSYGQENGLRLSDTLSPQFKWLKMDLTQNQQQWTVIYFHHPPFSKGSHDADAEKELSDIRKNVVPVFDEFGVDLVISGHSHNYERSYLLRGYTGKENEFTKEKDALSTSSAKYDGSENSCPYIKADSGTVYVVTGTAGWVGGTSDGYPHDAMYYSNSNDTGALLMHIEENQFSVKYLSSEAEVLDKFTLMKNVNLNQTLKAACGDKIELKTSWNGPAIWNETISSLGNITLDSLKKDTVWTAKDQFSCLTDTYNIKVDTYPIPQAMSNAPILRGDDLNLSGNFTGKGTLSWKGPNGFSSSLVNPVIQNVGPSNSGEYSLIASYKDCQSTGFIQVQIIPLLSASTEFDQKQLTVFPNPAHEEVNIYFTPRADGDYFYTFYDLNGRLLRQEKLQLSKGETWKQKIDVKALSSKQVLLLKFGNTEKSNTFKIIRY